MLTIGRVEVSASERGQVIFLNNHRSVTKTRSGLTLEFFDPMVSAWREVGYVFNVAPLTQWQEWVNMMDEHPDKYELSQKCVDCGWVGQLGPETEIGIWKIRPCPQCRSQFAVAA